MTQRDPSATPGAAALLEDWVTIWQSELAALAVDREAHEATQRIVDAWAAHMRLLARAAGSAIDAASGPAGPGAPPRPAAAGAAPDGRDALITQLLDRVAELERRLGPPT